MTKTDILKNRLRGNADRAAEMGVQLHRARKAKKPDDMEEAVEGGKMDNEAAEKPTGQPFSPAANLGKYHHPPKKAK